MNYRSSHWLLSGASLVLLNGCAAKIEAEDARTSPPLVPVAKVQVGHEKSASYTGIVKARVESALGFRVPGKITERLVDTGQIVHKGQPLYKLDPADLVHNMVARQDSVSSQRGSVESKRSSVEAARAHMIQAIADEKRYREAVSEGVVTEQSYDQYKAAAESARAEFAAAEAEVRAAQEQVLSLQSQAKVAENEKSYSILYSDCDGTVIETIAEPGQVVSAGQSVVKVARQGPREAVVNLPETLRPKLGSHAEAKVYDNNIPTCEAQLRQLSDSAEPLSRTFEARYVLEGVAANAPLGSTVTITPESTSQAKPQLVVPLTALIDKGHGFNVWIVDSQSSVVHMRPVQVALLGNEEAVISGGLKNGERFVTQGAHLLHENDKVRIALASEFTGPAPLTTPPHESE